MSFGDEYVHLRQDYIPLPSAIRDCFRKRTTGLISIWFRAQGGGLAHGNKQVRHSPFILFPSAAILALTSLDVSDSAMNNHCREEERVKPGEGRLKSGDQPPR